MTPDEKKDVLASIDELDVQFQVFAMNGLGLQPQTFNGALSEAREAVKHDHEAEAHAKLTDAQCVLWTKVYSKGILWRGLHVLALPQYFYFVAVIALTAIVLLPAVSLPGDQLNAAAAWVQGLRVVPATGIIALIGVLGGSLEGLIDLSHHSAHVRVRSMWIGYIIVSPVLAALTGTIAVLFLSVGLVALSGTAGASSAPGAGVVLPVAASITPTQVLVAILGGYNWRWVQTQLRRFAARVELPRHATPPNPRSTPEAEQPA